MGQDQVQQGDVVTDPLSKVTLKQSFNISSRKMMNAKGLRRKGAYSVLNISGEIITDDEELLNLLRSGEASLDLKFRSDPPYRHASNLLWVSKDDIVFASRGATIDVEEIS